VVQPSQERQPSRTGRLPRRVTDRVEDAAAWALTATALLVLLGAVLGGVGGYGGAVDRARTAAHERTPVALFDAVVVGASAGVGIAIVGCLVLGSAWLGLRRWLDRRNAADWGREWDLIEPEWSGRKR
jgi:ABC-type Fe3+ transport system permease subunit